MCVWTLCGIGVRRPAPATATAVAVAAESERAMASAETRKTKRRTREREGDRRTVIKVNTMKHSQLPRPKQTETQACYIYFVVVACTTLYSPTRDREYNKSTPQYLRQRQSLNERKSEPNLQSYTHFHAHIDKRAISNAHVQLGS